MTFCLAIPLTSVVVGATYNDYSKELEYVALPFPEPSSFGDNACAVVFWDSGHSRYEYWVFEPLGNISFEYQCMFNFNSPNFYFQRGNSGGVHLTHFRFWYYPDSSTYSVSSWQIQETDGIYSANGPSGTVVDPSSLFLYGNVACYSYSATEVDTAYTFNNDISPYVFKQMSSDLGEIKLYCSEILEALGQGDSYVPSETTTNAVIDGYNQAEQELMTNQFNNIDNVVNNLPDFNGGDMGAYNHSFAFISDMMNFVSGNGSGYGSAASSMAKISGVILVILSLGFTSFIIGLVNRRKE